MKSLVLMRWTNKYEFANRLTLWPESKENKNTIICEPGN